MATLPLLSRDEIASRFVPIVLGGEIFAYSLARCFHDAYGIKTMVLSAVDVQVTSSSRYVDYRICPEMGEGEEAIVELLSRLGEKLKQQGKVALVIGSADWHARLLSSHKEELSRWFAVPYNDFELLDEIEKELGIVTCPINWPIGSGKKFRGVYDRNTNKILTFTDTQKGTKEGTIEEIDLDSPHALEVMDPEQKAQLLDEIELLDGASADFDQELVSKGKLTPVFFGSALTNFGVETFLEHFLKMTTSPLPRVSDIGEIDPMDDDFSAFVFKIQANMNKAHRDRIAFMRICSGKFDASQEVYHVQGDKKMRLLQPQQMMAESRHVVDEAYAGDIIGVFDPGIFSIGDTICAPGKKFAFEGIPTFAPEHFARVRQIDTMKRKQFVKGINQIAQEGAIQIFQEFNTGMEEIIVGVVGVLQFDVLKYRLENEYNVDIRLEKLPYEHIRWIANKEEINLDRIQGTSDMKKVMDLKGNPLLLFVNPWSVGMVQDRNKDLVLTEFSKN